MIKPILVVDLDDTLIKTDMLHETFWSAFSLDWKIIIKTFCKIFSCKAKLKKFLYSKSNVEVDLLPYNENIIKYIKEFRSKGGKTALVTASNQAVAQKIAHYLDIFDEVHGSSGSNNLKGENKAKFLSSHYKNSKFIYIGDSYTDLYVWKVAQKAITIGANLRLQNKVELINKNYEHLTSDKILISNFIKAMRPHQWLKNILVFLPMLAAHQLETQTFVKSIVAFFSFSFIASSVYIINDLLDLNADRAHSSKKKQTICIWFNSNKIWRPNRSFTLYNWFIFSFTVQRTISLHNFFLLFSNFSLFVRFKAYYTRRYFLSCSLIYNKSYRRWTFIKYKSNFLVVSVFYFFLFVTRYCKTSS